MMDWDEIIQTTSAEELREAKLWLFREHMRLEDERKNLEEAQEKFLNERVKIRDEIDELNRKTVIERKRLKEENLFFEKKMDILKNGFLQLDEDRKSFEKQKQSFLAENRKREESSFFSGDIAECLFRGINNPLALRKRYRDLTKIFHPDNLFGDEEIAQMINREYVKRKREMFSAD